MPYFESMALLTYPVNFPSESSDNGLVSQVLTKAFMIHLPIYWWSLKLWKNKLIKYMITINIVYELNLHSIV